MPKAVTLLPQIHALVPMKALQQTCVEYTLPMVIENPLNGGKTWQSLLKLKASQRAISQQLLRSYASRYHLTVYRAFRVLLVRVAPKRFDDDGLAAGFKHVRDGISDALFVNDGDTERIRFDYRQEQAPTPRTYGVKVRIVGQRELFKPEAPLDWAI